MKNGHCRIFKDSEYGDVTHQAIWSDYLAPLIAKHYKIDPDKVVGVESLRDVYTCMPRGRVYLVIDQKWTMAHGNDTPIEFKKAQMLIPAQFGLTKHVLNGLVKWKFEEHETMSNTDQKVAQTLLGKIPYRR